ncbi:metalloregulator ArsR/SmtB family transcription factor [Geobacter sp. AOG2]|uniref:ArsR/SmtB family transcription factor n=1 Tax=Geobacter sp. AOG2 TaxID=1566347 RepID=UPI0027E4D099|nr:metalloregulator ArsR/SmtB family transcription factor [Geobacter sp. AOG2]
MARLIKILGHPVRLKILSNMIHESKCVRNIWESLGLQQATVSQHISLLKTNGIVEGRRKGGEMYYTISSPLAKRLVDSLSRNDVIT